MNLIEQIKVNDTSIDGYQGIYYTESPEYVYVKTDAQDRILCAIKADGTIYYGAGVPPQVVEYINNKIADFKFEDIVTFLGNLITEDKTLQDLLDEKVNIEEGKSLINSEYAEGVSFVRNSDWADVLLDKNGKIVEGLTKEGKRYISYPLLTPFCKAKNNLIDFTLIQLRQGSAYTPSNTVSLSHDNIIPVNNRKKIYVGTDRPLGINEKYIYSFNLYPSSSGTTAGNNSRIRTLNGSSGNYIIVRDGELGFSVTISILNINNGQYKEITPKDFDGYSFWVSETLLDYYSSIDALINKEKTEKDNSIVYDCYNRNRHQEKYLVNACRLHKESETSKDLQLCLIADMHADTLALNNAVKMCDKFTSIDALLALGDLNMGYYRENIGFYDITNEGRVPCYTVVGNHDVGYSPQIGVAGSHEEVYNKWIEPLINNLSNGEHTGNNNYYYHDFDEYKIRLICLYEYDDYQELNTTYWEEVSYDSSYPEVIANHNYVIGDYVNAGGRSFKCIHDVETTSSLVDNTRPSYKHYRGFVCYRKEQIDWFMKTIASTPAGYGVVVAGHQIMVYNNWDFYQGENVFNAGNVGGYGMDFLTMGNMMGTDIISDIVNAFVNKEQFSENVAYSNIPGKNAFADKNIYTDEHGNAYAYTVSYDFSNVAENTKFMCYLAGHIHGDYIFKHKQYNQYLIVATCAITNYPQSQDCDIRRTDYDSLAKDSLTVISFDVDNEKIRLCKLGVNITIDGVHRDFSVFNL